MSAAEPRVALVGRPNVGKSTLYNRLIGKRIAVVADVAGTTRDRLENPVDWEGRRFWLMDMAGLEPSLSDDTELSRGTQAQVFKALADADLVLWVVDGRAGLTLADEQIATQLRALHKPVLVVVNKTDHPKHEVAQYEFAQFGFIDTFPISALNGRNASDLLDRIIELIPGEIQELIQDPEEIRISIVGRPNVGKSTLLNQLAGEERSVVSPIAGTTRDSVDSVIPAAQLFGSTYTKWKRVRIIDTAGIRRRGKIEYGIESWSLVRTLDAVDQSQVVLLLLDAEDGIAMQDLHIAQKITDSGRAMIILLNKWDTVLAAKHIEQGSEQEESAQSEFLTTLRNMAPFLHWVQVLFMSAKESINLEVVGKLVLSAYTAWSFDVPQEELDELAIHIRKTPAMRNLQRLELQSTQPPIFRLYIEGRALPHFSSHRFVENALRDFFNLGPTPIKIWSQTSMEKKRHK